MTQHAGRYSYYVPPTNDAELEEELDRMLQEEEWVVLEKELKNQTIDKAEKFANAVIRGEEVDLSDEDYDSEEDTSPTANTKATGKKKEDIEMTKGIKHILEPTIAIGHEMNHFISNILLGQQDKINGKSKKSEKPEKPEKAEKAEKAEKEKSSKLKKRDSADKESKRKSDKPKDDDLVKLKEEILKQKEENKKEFQRKKDLKKREKNEKKVLKLREKLANLESELDPTTLSTSSTSLPSTGVTIPTYWIFNKKISPRSSLGGTASPLQPDEYTEMELPPDSEEFQNVFNLMNSNVGSHGKYGSIKGQDPIGFDVKRIIRVQNLELWRRFEFARNGIMKQNEYQIFDKDSTKYLGLRPVLTPSLDQHSNEFYLFHGTKWDVINIVKRKGFDERVGSVTGMFGAGIYFAENASKSNQYVPCPECGKGAIFTTGNCECEEVKSPYGMILCRVILGDIHIAPKYDQEKYKGTKDKPVRRPPSKSENALELYDSVLGESKLHGGDTLNYREFIVYDRFQVYPEYIIYFDRIGPPFDRAQNATEEELRM